jgi:hypothetical protein
LMEPYGGAGAVHPWNHRVPGSPPRHFPAAIFGGSLIDGEGGSVFNVSC